MLRSLPRVSASFRRLALTTGALSEDPSFRIDLAAGDPRRFPHARDFAYTTDETRPIRIVVAPKLEHQHRHRIEGVMRHELAHALLILRGVDHTEREADVLAHRLFGDPIRYDADTVQTTDPSAPHAQRPVILGP